MGYQRSARTVAITQLHQAAKTPKERHECALDALLQRVLQDLSATTPRQLSLITWSLARLHLRRDLRGLKSTLERRAFELDPQGVSMTMWSLAAALWRQPLFDRLGEAAYWKLGELDAQGLSNVLWSCAVLRKDQSGLTHAVQHLPIRIVSHASSQAAANLVWATALLSAAGSPLQEEASRLAANMELQPAEAAAVVWAVAKALAPGPQAVTALYSITAKATDCSSSKVLAACAWSFATLIFRDQEVWQRIETAASRCSFSTQELANIFWAFGTSNFLGVSSQSMWEACGSMAVELQQEFSPVEVAAVSWAMAVQRFVWPSWSTAATCPTLRGLNLRGLASIAWSWTILQFATDVLHRVAERSNEQIEAHRRAEGEATPSRADVYKEQITPTLQLVWSLSFSQVDTSSSQEVFASSLRLLQQVGKNWDYPGKAPALSHPAAPPANDDEPTVLLCAEGLVFLRKPPGWEVDGSSDVSMSSDCPKLSRFLQQQFPARPVLRDFACGLGFLGRLDVPAAGIVVAALSYQAYFTLRMQQEMLLIQREYVVLCHGEIHQEQVLSGRVRAVPGSGSFISQEGVPAETQLLPCAWLLRGDEIFTLLLVSILTGRKHQIRVHLAEEGHPVVGDTRYGKRADLAWCPHQFLYRYRVAFPWPEALTLEATSVLPSDLRKVLAGLEARDEQSAQAAHHWASAAAPVSFSGWKE